MMNKTQQQQQKKSIIISWIKFIISETKNEEEKG